MQQNTEEVQQTIGYYHMDTSITGRTIQCFQSTLACYEKLNSKARTKELIVTWLISAYTWARQHVPVRFKSYRPERVTFVPTSMVHTHKPYLDITTPWESDYGLVIPVSCLSVITQHKHKGGGVFSVRSPHCHSYNTTGGVRLHSNERTTRNTFSFRRIVCLPAWMEKYHCHTICELLDDSMLYFVDAVFFTETKDALFMAFDVS